MVICISNLFDKIELAKEMLGDTINDLIAENLDLKEYDGKKSYSPFREETNKSFIWNEKGKYFKDFGNGKVVGILDSYMISKNLSYYEAVKKLFESVGLEFSESDFSSIGNSRKCSVAIDEPENDRKIVEDYSAKRCLSAKTLDFCNVKQSGCGDMAFQFFDENNILISTKYRTSRPCSNKEQKKWTWQHGCDVFAMLYGINRINIEKPLLICEGLPDRCACVEAGYSNVVSIPGGANDYNWIDFNYDFLDKFREIILWFDDDTPGKEGARVVATRLGEFRVKTVIPPVDIKESIKKYFEKFGQDIDKVDANNVLVCCGADNVLRTINEAKAVDNPLVKHLMDVEEIQLQDLPRISTGIIAMDKQFYGSFSNSLTILTGQAGSGKTSILNTMFVAAPLEAGEKVFIYSGEIPNGILLGNIIKPLASRRHVRVFKNENAPDGYSVTFKAAKEIKKYYRDLIFNYDDSNSFDTNSLTILSSMEYSYKRYGVTNFIVDSLLTVDCSREHGDDKYDKQKNFVMNLKNFTNRFPVRVALVAHSRKLMTGEKDINMDSIQGSSDIVKISNRAYSISRIDNDPDGFSAVISCLKDRESGMTGKFVKLKYDRQSYRIYSTEQELDRAYRWEYDCQVNYTDEEKKMLSENVPEQQELREVFGVVKNG